MFVPGRSPETNEVELYNLHFVTLFIWQLGKINIRTLYIYQKHEIPFIVSKSFQSLSSMLFQLDVLQ